MPYKSIEVRNAHYRERYRSFTPEQKAEICRRQKAYREAKKKLVTAIQAD